MQHETHTYLKETWLSRKPHPEAGFVAIYYGLLVLFVSSAYWGDWGGLQSFLAAKRPQIFENSEFWRLWSALFVHADMGHLLANLLLLLPLTYLLSSFFGLYFLPMVSVLAGGLINYFVVQSLPTATSLMGISGVVYLMGALWMTLYFLIDRRNKWRKRFAQILFITVLLFTPETFKPEVSYLSHAIGFLMGMGLGFIYYAFHRKKFLAAEVYEVLIEEPMWFEDMTSFSPTADKSDISH